HAESHNLTILGLVGLQDPLRPEAAATIKELSEAGIRTVVVTGDHKDTAQKIAEGAGINIREGGCITGVQLDVMSDDVLYDRITSIDLFARVDPKHKIRIVDAWQKQGNCVAMIGDGVNDAPALKVADIGVALGSGSDVAHEISDMVLLDNNLSTISAAVQQGRIIFDNIRKIIVYLMADSFSEIILIAGSMLLGLPLPILATQILWINLVTDGFPDIALTMEPGEPEIMHEKPRPKDEPVMNTEMKALIFIIGIITDLGLFGLYWGLLQSEFDLPHIRTIIFTALAIDSLLYVFSVRSFRTPLFRMNPFKNKWLNLAVVGGLIVQLAAIYLPSMQRLFSTVSLGRTEWMIILALALVKITGIEITKDWFIRRNQTGSKT
ncbi:HAD-IC family P-type ATPase, partial [Candidatus Babeliales bacterium]|nr:HAD-IC family P-type ATPase [Candidatus Babeliales bacterium]